MIDDVNLYKLLLKAKKHNILVCVHAENGEIIHYLSSKYLKEGKKTPVYHALSRPAELEGEAASKVIKFSKLTGTAVYFVHVSSKNAVSEIKKAKKKGLKVFAETCPQYLFLNSKKYEEEDFEGAKYVMSPPLREQEHCESLKKVLKKEIIDVIATDHCPFNFHKEKQAGLNDFSRIPNGIPGIETRMPIMYNEMVVNMGMDLTEFVKLNCSNPAKLFGMKSKGDIKPGKDADIVIWNPDKIWKIKANQLHQNVDYTPYENQVINGKPVTVILRGKIIIENEHLKVGSGGGKYVHRQPSEI
jgi:dihydropyrimidinase